MCHFQSKIHSIYTSFDTERHWLAKCIQAIFNVHETGSTMRGKGSIDRKKFNMNTIVSKKKILKGTPLIDFRKELDLVQSRYIKVLFLSWRQPGPSPHDRFVSRGGRAAVYPTEQCKNIHLFYQNLCTLIAYCRYLQDWVQKMSSKAKTVIATGASSGLVRRTSPLSTLLA